VPDRVIIYPVTCLQNYSQVQPEIHVRIQNLPVSDKLRDLRQAHLNSFVRVSGVVTRRTNVFPQLRVIRYVVSVDVTWPSVPT